jgi:hypothetical protein
MMSNEHLSAESLYLYADHVYSYENWSHEIKHQTNLFMIIFFCKILIGYHVQRFNE